MVQAEVGPRLWGQWPWKHFASHAAKSELYLLDKPTQGSRRAPGAATVCARHPEGPWLKCQEVKLHYKQCLYPNRAREKGPDVVLNWSRSQPCPGVSSPSADQGVQTHTWHPLAAVQVPPDASISPPRHPNRITRLCSFGSPMGHSWGDRNIFGPRAG